MSQSVRTAAERLAKKYYPGLRGTVLANGQSFDPILRRIVVSTAGTLTGQMANDTADVAYVFPIGEHEVAVKSITTLTTLVGVGFR